MVEDFGRFEEACEVLTGDLIGVLDLIGVFLF
jgi:hypothetical protein